MYNVYVDEMSHILNNASTGCCINNVLIYHLMYADDVVLMAPSAEGLQFLIDKCYSYDMFHNPARRRRFAGGSTTKSRSIASGWQPGGMGSQPAGARSGRGR